MALGEIFLAGYSGKSRSGSQSQQAIWFILSARGASHLARLGLPAVSREQNFPKSHIINPFLSGIDNSHNLIQMFLRNLVFQNALKTRHIVVNIVVNFEATYCRKFSIEERILSGKSQRKIMVFETLYYLGNSCFSHESDLPLLNLPPNECCVVTRLCGQLVIHKQML